jgi:hypothetical protein
MKNGKFRETRTQITQIRHEPITIN